MDLIKQNNKFTVTVKHEDDVSLSFIKTLPIITMTKDEIVERIDDALKNYHLDIKTTNRAENGYEVSFNGEINYNLFINLYRTLNTHFYSINHINDIFYSTLPDNEEKRIEILKDYWKHDSSKSKYIYCISLMDGYNVNTFSNTSLEIDELPCLVITHSEPCYTWGNVYDETGDERVLRCTGSDVLLIEEAGECGVIIDTQLELERSISIINVLEYILDDIRYNVRVSTIKEMTNA